MNDTLLLKDSDVAALLNISRAMFWKMVADGRFGPMALSMGRSKRWRRSDVELYVRWGLPERAVFVQRLESEATG
ncbi:MAG: helix-turn-helix domain-containing protein [Phycisphaerae bacterium]|nr:helix-turn-helix domain-containing protein [Phycisphaerae bacterium]